MIDGESLTINLFYGGKQLFVKIYEYHINQDKEEFFLEIQDKVSQIYNKYLCCEVMYLKSIDDATVWVEIAKYSSEEEYFKHIKNLNNEPVIQELFEQFESCLIPGKMDIRERDFIMKKLLS